MGDMSSSDLFNSSVAELRRKAQEHSAALWQLAQSVQVQQQQQQQQQGEQLPKREEEAIKEEKEAEPQEHKSFIDVDKEQKVFIKEDQAVGPVASP